VANIDKRYGRVANIDKRYWLTRAPRASHPRNYGDRITVTRARIPDLYQSGPTESVRGQDRQAILTAIFPTSSPHAKIGTALCIVHPPAPFRAPLRGKVPMRCVGEVREDRESPNFLH